MEKILIKNPEYLSYASKNLLSNKNFIKSFLINKITNTCNNIFFKYDDKLYSIIDESIRDDKEIIYIAVKEKNSDYFNKIPFALRRDYDLALEAVGSNPILYKDLPHELRNKKFIKDCIEYKIDIYTFLYDTNFEEDKDIIMDFININPNNYNFIPESLKNDPDILSLAFQLRINLPSDILQSLNKDLALLALQYNPIYFEFLNIQFRKDPDILRLVFQSKIGVSGDIFNSLTKELALFAVQHNIYVFEKLSDEFKNDPEIMKAQITYHIDHTRPGSLIIKNKDLALKLLKINKKSYEYLTRELKYDKDMIMKSDVDISRLLPSMPHSLLEDSQFMIECYEKILNKTQFLSMVPNAGITKEFVDHIIKVNPNSLKFLSKKTNNVELIKLLENNKIYPDTFNHYKHYVKKFPIIFINNNKYTQNMLNKPCLYVKEAVYEEKDNEELVSKDNEDLIVKENNNKQLKEVYESIKNTINCDNELILNEILEKLKQVLN